MWPLTALLLLGESSVHGQRQKDLGCGVSVAQAVCACVLCIARVGEHSSFPNSSSLSIFRGSREGGFLRARKSKGKRKTGLETPRAFPMVKGPLLSSHPQHSSASILILQFQAAGKLVSLPRPSTQFPKISTPTPLGDLLGYSPLPGSCLLNPHDPSLPLCTSKWVPVDSSTVWCLLPRGWFSNVGRILEAGVFSEWPTPDHILGTSS